MVSAGSQTQEPIAEAPTDSLGATSGAGFMIPKHDRAEFITTIWFDYEAGQVAAAIVHNRNQAVGKATLSAFHVGHEDDIQVARYTFSKAVDLSVTEGEPTELGEELSVIGRQRTNLSLGLRNEFGRGTST